MSFNDLLSFIVYVKKSAAILLGLSLYVTNLFSCNFQYSLLVLYVECFD
jgi:hypothetical protein